MHDRHAYLTRAVAPRRPFSPQMARSAGRSLRLALVLLSAAGCLAQPGAVSFTCPDGLGRLTSRDGINVESGGSSHLIAPYPGFTANPVTFCNDLLPSWEFLGTIPYSWMIDSGEGDKSPSLCPTSDPEYYCLGFENMIPSSQFGVGGGNACGTCMNSPVVAHPGGPLPPPSPPMPPSPPFPPSPPPSPPPLGYNGPSIAGAPAPCACIVVQRTPDCLAMSTRWRLPLRGAPPHRQRGPDRRRRHQHRGQR